MVIVSHDREFLDQLCTKIVETERGISATFKGARGSAGLGWSTAGWGEAARSVAAAWHQLVYSCREGCRCPSLPQIGGDCCPASTAQRAAAAGSWHWLRTCTPRSLLPCRQLHRVREAEGGGHRAAVGGLGEAAERDFAAGAMKMNANALCSARLAGWTFACCYCWLHVAALLHAVAARAAAAALAVLLP